MPNSTLIGTENDDILIGQEGVIEILGLRGNDFISHTLTSDDLVLIGGGGDDTIKSGTGNDLLQGHWGKDEIYGNAGADTIDGGSRDDTLYGGNGDDKLVGGHDNGNDVLFGEEGNDTLQGGKGDDFLYGGDHSDLIFTGNGNDFADAGLGNDRVVYVGAGMDTLDGGVGFDNLNVRASGTIHITDSLDLVSDATVAVNFEKVVANGSGNRDIVIHDLQAIESLTVDASSLDGALTLDASATSASLLVTGSDANDVITDGQGNDEIIGGLGDDVITYTGGYDAILGGEGADTLIIDNNAERVVLSPGTSNYYNPWEKIINMDLAFEAIKAGSSGLNIEMLRSPSGHTIESLLVEGHQTEANNVVVENGMYFAEFYGGDAADNFDLEGVRLSEISLGSGDDTTSLYDCNSSEIYLGDGNDYYESGLTSSATVYGGNGDDIIHGSYESRIEGGDGNDIIYSGGSDIVEGGRGADTIYGGDGKDDIILYRGNKTSIENDVVRFDEDTATEISLSSIPGFSDVDKISGFGDGKSVIEFDFASATEVNFIKSVVIDFKSNNDSFEDIVVNSLFIEIENDGDVGVFIGDGVGSGLDENSYIVSQIGETKHIISVADVYLDPLTYWSAEDFGVY